MKKILTILLGICMCVGFIIPSKVYAEDKIFEFDLASDKAPDYDCHVTIKANNYVRGDIYFDSDGGPYNYEDEILFLKSMNFSEEEVSNTLNIPKYSVSGFDVENIVADSLDVTMTLNDRNDELYNGIQVLGLNSKEFFDVTKSGTSISFTMPADESCVQLLKDYKCTGSVVYQNNAYSYFDEETSQYKPVPKAVENEEFDFIFKAYDFPYMSTSLAGLSFVDPEIPVVHDDTERPTYEVDFTDKTYNYKKYKLDFGEVITSSKYMSSDAFLNPWGSDGTVNSPVELPSEKLVEEGTLSANTTFSLKPNECIIIENEPTAETFVVEPTNIPKGFTYKGDDFTFNQLPSSEEGSSQAGYFGFDFDFNGEIEIVAAKVLNDEQTEVPGGKFEFALKDEEGNIIETKKNGHGILDGDTGETIYFFGDTTSFNKITLTEKDILDKSTFTYYLSETNLGEKGYTYDDTVHKITVTLDKNENDEWVLSEVRTRMHVEQQQAESVPSNAIVRVFTNYYREDAKKVVGKFKPTANKEIPGFTTPLLQEESQVPKGGTREQEAGQVPNDNNYVPAHEIEGFTFKLIKDNGEIQQVIQTTHPTHDGDVLFDEITYTEDDIGKTYTYKVVEDKSHITSSYIVHGYHAEYEYAYDEHVLTYTVTVTKDGVDVKTEGDTTFTNLITNTELCISKEVEGSKANTQKEFQFVVEVNSMGIREDYVPNYKAYSYINIEKTPKEITVQDNRIYFTLKHNEVIYIEGIPCGWECTITEDAQDYKPGYSDVFQNFENHVSVPPEIHKSAGTRELQEPGVLVADEYGNSVTGTIQGNEGKDVRASIWFLNTRNSIDYSFTPTAKKIVPVIGEGADIYNQPKGTKGGDTKEVHVDVQGGPSYYYENFTFQLVQDKGEDEEELIQTVHPNESGDVTFDKISYTEDDIGKTYIYKIREVRGENMDPHDYAYDEHTLIYTVTVTEDGVDVKTEGDKTFTNLATDSTLKISKWTNGYQLGKYDSENNTFERFNVADKQKEFQFVVEVDPNGIREDYVPDYKASKEITVKDNKIYFTLKNGEEITIEGIPYGWTYTITEDPENYSPYIHSNKGEYLGQSQESQVPEGGVLSINPQPDVKSTGTREQHLMGQLEEDVPCDKHTDGNSITWTMDTDTETHKFENTLSLTVPTRADIGINFYILIPVCVGGGIVAFVLRRKFKKAE